MKLEQLSGPYGIHLVSELQFSFGECIGLIGPNGAGKSTLLRLLFGAIKPREGWISIDGENIDKLAHQQRTKLIGYLPPNETLVPNLTVFQSVSMALYTTTSIFKTWNHLQIESIERAIERVGLHDQIHVPIGHLSSGQYQRVRLARLLLRDSRILLLDEPFSFLDPKQADVMQNLLHDLREDNRIIVVSIHQLNYASELCDKLLLLKDGHQMAWGPTEEVLKSSQLRTVFGVDFVNTLHPETGNQVVLLPRKKAK